MGIKCKSSSGFQTNTVIQLLFAMTLFRNLLPITDSQRLTFATNLIQILLGIRTIRQRLLCGEKYSQRRGPCEPPKNFSHVNESWFTEFAQNGGVPYLFKANEPLVR